MAITKQKGDLAEAFLIYVLRQKGFNVLVPFGEDNRYDLVAEHKGIFKRIQVKYVTPKNGVLEVPIRSANNHKVIHYSISNVDIVAAYNPLGNKVYFIPLNKIRNRSLLKLRLMPSKNRQKKLICFAKKFESRFDFLLA